MKQIPILFLSDAPALSSGLARIGRDLASLTSKLPEYRVGYLGRGTAVSRKCPFAQYSFEPTAADQWGIGHIEHAWMDFAGDDEGVIFTIQDPSRMLWFARPTPDLGPVHNFLTSGRFRRWGYFPVDATGPSDRLSATGRATVQNYNRVLAYTNWGAGVLERSIGRPVDWIPHGLSLDIFQPRDRAAARMAMGFREQDLVVGMVATNQARKDFGCAFAAISALRRERKNLHFWLHTDALERHWSVNALASDYGVGDILTATLSSTMSDKQMSYGYSACDVTILPAPEGFGYPIVESMACGVPCLHGNCGGGAELLPPDLLIEPSTWRLDTPHNCVRPVFEPADWVAQIDRYLENPMSAEECRTAVEHLNWKQLWPACWKKWFLQ